LQYVASFFGGLSASGYRPLSLLIYDLGIRSITDPNNPPFGWLFALSLMYGSMASLLFLVSRRFLRSTAFSLLATALYVLSPPVASASWVLFAGLQPLVIMVICLGLLLYWKIIESPSHRWLWLSGLGLVMLVGPWIREFCGLLPVLILLLELQRARRPTGMMLFALLFFLHALYPSVVPRLTFAPSAPVANIFEMGLLGTQISKIHADPTTPLLRLWNSMRWYAASHFLDLFPPLLFSLAGMTLAARTLGPNRQGGRIWSTVILGFLAVLLLGFVGVVPAHFTAFWICLGLGLLVLRENIFLAAWFLLSFLPFFKVYTEHVHFAYALAPAAIILAKGAEELWTSLKGRGPWRQPLRWALGTALALIVLDQGAMALGSRAVILGTYQGIKAVGQILRERTPSDSAVICNAVHGEDVRLYSKNHFRTYWTVTPGVSLNGRSLDDFESFRNFYLSNVMLRPIYFLDMDQNYFINKIYHRHKYIHSMRLPNTDLGKLHTTLVRYPFLDPLRHFTNREDMAFLGAPDLVNDFYTGPAQDGSWFMRETSVDYHLYEVGQDKAAFLAALEKAEKEYVPDHLPVLVQEGYQGYNFIRYGGRYYALKQGFSFDAVTASRNEYAQGVLFSAENDEGLIRQLQVNRAPEPAPEPQLLESYLKFNIIKYGDDLYILAQDEGAFDVSKFEKGAYRRAAKGNNAQALKTLVDKGEFGGETQKNNGQAAGTERPLQPHLLESYKKFNIIKYGNDIYLLAQGEGEFDVGTFERGGYTRAAKGTSIEELKALVDAGIISRQIKKQ